MELKSVDCILHLHANRFILLSQQKGVTKMSIQHSKLTELSKRFCNGTGKSTDNSFITQAGGHGLMARAAHRKLQDPAVLSTLTDEELRIAHNRVNSVPTSRGPTNGNGIAFNDCAAALQAIETEQAQR
jgi:hypothetical protein